MKNKPNIGDRYHYTQCGLDNVYINGLHFEDDVDQSYAVITCIGYLHWLIAGEIIKQKTFMTGKEVYFLRAKLGLSYDRLAEKIGICKEDIALWEQDEYAASDAVETSLRTLVRDELIAGTNIENSGWNKKQFIANKGQSAHINIKKDDDISSSTMPYCVEAA